MQTGLHLSSRVSKRSPTVVEITPNTASLELKTTEEVLCAWVYGPTTAYGEVATHSTLLMGFGHKDHKPLLHSLRPDTLYHFKAGAVGVDGTVYTSEDLTFRTPPESRS